ncbi:MAG: hypothetical protein JRJ29_17035 [Deltaproteobacteria bacterium]|nr:hypothetical protein [Deltaproteobacteria bacterium]
MQGLIFIFIFGLLMYLLFFRRGSMGGMGCCGGHGGHERDHDLPRRPGMRPFDNTEDNVIDLSEDEYTVLPLKEGKGRQNPSS